MFWGFIVPHAHLCMVYSRSYWDSENISNFITDAAIRVPRVLWAKGDETIDVLVYVSEIGIQYDYDWVCTF